MAVPSECRFSIHLTIRLRLRIYKVHVAIGIATLVLGHLVRPRIHRCLEGLCHLLVTQIKWLLILIDHADALTGVSDRCCDMEWSDLQ